VTPNLRLPVILRLAALTAACALPGFAAAPAPVDSSSALISILVRKGILTPDEAMQIQKEAAAQAAASAPMAAPGEALGSGAPAPAAPAMAPAVANSSVAPLPADGSMPAKALPPPPGRSPLSFKIGIADFTPFGFVDFQTVYRSTQDGGDVASSYGSFAYPNTANGQLSETRFSSKFSRFGVRVDSKVGDTKVLGYVETDFLGNAATNVNVASNSNVLRMRLYYVDLRRGDWELLAGQGWSLMTPNRKGLSPLSSDVFFTQVADPNFHVGLVWGRTPQIRAVYHASDELTFGVSLENPDQYVGAATTLPTGFTTTEVDNGSNGTATPNTFPDTIGKAAFDTTIAGLPFHVDAAGLVRFFRVNTYTASLNANASATGYAGSANAVLSLTPSLQLFGNFFDGNGGGRYISTGLGPDFIVNPANARGVYTLSLINSYAGLGGVEWTVLPKTQLFGYYGSAYYGRKTGTNLNGTIGSGYGYTGSANSNNRQIGEATVGFVQTLWKNPNYGDLKVIGEYSYLNRTPWYVAPGAPGSAHMNMLYLDLRYDLP
jgi:hypothetical protein